jgi:hypothetical protein
MILAQRVKKFSYFVDPEGWLQLATQSEFNPLYSHILFQHKLHNFPPSYVCMMQLVCFLWDFQLKFCIRFLRDVCVVCVLLRSFYAVYLI